MLFFAAAVLCIPSWRKIFFPSYATGALRVNERIAYFDIVRGIAIIAVILGHTAYFYYRNHQGNDILFLSAINHISRFAIPFFLICSGMFLSDTFSTWRDAVFFYKKKIIKIFAPFFLINVLIFFFITKGAAREFFSAFITGTIQLPYYYIIMLFQLYVLFPLLTFLREKRSALVLVFFISLFFLPFPAKAFVYSLPFAGPYFFLFFYGMYRRHDFLRLAVSPREGKIWFCVLALYVLVFIISPGVYFNSQIFYGIALWNLCMMYREYVLRIPWLSSVLAFLGRNSLWMYLLHYLLIKYTYGFFVKVPLEYHIGFILISIVSVCVSAGAGYGAACAYNFLVQSMTKVIGRVSRGIRDATSL